MLLRKSPGFRFCPQLAASGGVSLVAALACKDDTLIPCCPAACARFGGLQPCNAFRVLAELTQRCSVGFCLTVRRGRDVG